MSRSTRLFNVLKAALLAIALLCSFCSVANQQQFKVVVGVDQSPPYQWLDERGLAHGPVVDLVRHLIVATGGKPVFVSCPWARCMKMAEHGDIDVLVGINKTAERETFFHFIPPALIDGRVLFEFYQPEGALPILSHKDLQQKRIGVLRGAKYYDAFDQDDQITKVEFVDMATAVASLHLQRIDALIQVAGVVLPPENQATPLQVEPYQTSMDASGWLVLSKRTALLGYEHKLADAMAQEKNSSAFQALMQRLESLRH